MISPELLEMPEVVKALESLKGTDYSPEALLNSEKFWDIIRSNRALVQDAYRQGYDIGFKIGYEIGLKEGREMAFADGIEEGKVMGINAVSTHAALTLYGFGYPVNDIAKATGLLATEIEELVSNLFSET